MAVKYPARVDAMVTDELRYRIKAATETPTAQAEGLGLSDVVREALEAGLPHVEARLRRGPVPVAFVPA